MTTAMMNPALTEARGLPPGRYGISGLLKSEWTKLRTVRSTMWTLGITVVVGIGISALATAESTLMSAMAAYEKSRVELDRAVGVTLDHAGISIEDAAKGQVTRLPNVPYVAPRKDLPSNQTDQPQPQ